ncbi:Do family serine endopeptidase [Sphingomicrobium sp. XHP0239]|uniref:Do family serine endopeptidase n=1 Tax=Sphingomicrobium maritimum TaxID=3133972 RepID=UPI0031CCD1AD
MAKERVAVRYVYGMAAAMLMGGAAYSMTGGELAAQQAQNAQRPVPVQGAPESFAELAERLQPAVVNISTRQEIAVQRRSNDPFEQFFRRFGVPDPRSEQEGEEGDTITRESGSLGSGFVISADGYIITNNHLIQSRTDQNDTVDEVVVTFPDLSEYDARIIGRDINSDIAVLKIEGNDFPYVNWGDSNEVRVGDWVIAIGNPFGLNGTVTAGIVSALQRGVPQAANGATGAERYIQTDASINMGNSGGPMFDMMGNVVGVNSALYSPTGSNVGIGFAVPADQARRVAEALIRGERPQRGYLGVSLGAVDDALAAADGLERGRGEIVNSVVEGEAAERAGIREGDIILSIDGVPVDQNNNVSYLIANTPVDETVPVVVIRDGERRTINVRIGQRPTNEQLAAQLGAPDEEDDGMAAEDETPSRGGEALGMTLQPLNDQIRRGLRQSENQQGVVITRVEQGSRAQRQGIRRGDLIISVNRQPVTTPQEVSSLVEQARRSGREAVRLRIRRGQNETFVGVLFE